MTAAITIVEYCTPKNEAMTNATVPMTGGISVAPVEAQASIAAA